MGKPQVINNKYLLVEKIGESSLSSIWRGKNQETDEQVTVKILKKNATSQRIEDLIRFKKEVQLISRFENPYISPIIDSGNTSSELYVVFPHFAGESLQEYLDMNRPFSIEAVLQIAIQLCGALSYLHSHNITHRNIKPGNILLHPNNNISGGVSLTLIDSGISHIILFDKLPENALVQYFCYFSPEQCSSLKKEIDERSDLYSLGVLLYQMLTGELPFKSTTVNSLIYNHIAVIPESLRKKKETIPRILESLVLKLLEKEPEQRYQHAEGLLEDLIRISEGKQDFQLGFSDISNKMTYTTKIINRIKELGVIMESVGNMLLDAGSLCIVSGDAGTGKTRFLDHVKKYLFEQNLSFVSIQCHPGKKSGPYEAFTEIAQALIKQIFKNKNADDIDKLKNELKIRFHTIGQIIVKLSPELKQFIGSFPPIELSDENRDSARFLEILKEFFLYLSSFNDYTIILIDDFHWMDTSSLEIFLELFKILGKHPFLFLASMRENASFFESLEEHMILAKNIILENFNKISTNKFLSLLLHQAADSLKEITHYIYQRSKGNPFFTLELVKHLIEKGGLRQDKRNWFLDSPKLKTIELPRTLLDITIQKVALLSESDTKTLAYASIIGSAFNLEILLTITPIDNEQIIDSIDKVLADGVIVKDRNKKGILFFAHERLRHWFYNSLNITERQEIHLNIARLYEQTVSSVDNYIYELAHHFHEGNDLTASKKYILKAAEKAEKNYANDDAIEFCRLVISIEEKGKNKGSEDWIKSMRQMGRVFMVTGQLDEALDIFNQIMPLLKTRSAKLALYRLQSIIQFKKGNLEEVENITSLCLGLINQKLPQTGGSVFFSILKDSFFHVLNVLFPWRPHLFKAKIKKEDAINITWLFWVLHSIYALEGSWKAVSTSLRMVNFAQTNIGPSKELGMSYMVFGLTLAELTFYKSAERNHLRAIAIRKKYNDEWGLAHSYVNSGFLYKIKGDLKKAINYLRMGNEIYTKIGDIGHGTLGAGISGLAGAYLFISEYDNAKNTLDEYTAMSTKLDFTWGHIFAGMHFTTLYAETGDWDRAEEHGLKALESAKKQGDIYLICTIQVSLGRAFYIKGDIFNAKSHLEEGLETLLRHPKLLLEYVISVYPCLAETYIQEFSSESFSNNKEKRRFLRKIKHLCTISLKKTRMWKVSHVISLRAMAKYHSLTGRFTKADFFFNKCIDLCENLDRKYELAMTLFEYGGFLKKFGRFSQATEKIEAAYTIFKGIGARELELRLAALLGIKEDVETSSNRYIENRKYYQRLNTLISLSRDISSILNLQELVDLAISKAIEASSAYRGYIFLSNKKLGKIDRFISNTVPENSEVVFCREIVKDVFDRRQAVVKTDISKDTVFSQDAVVVKYNLKSVICVPIQHGNNIEGVCYLDNPLSVGVFSEDDVELLNVLMSQVAISIENARNYDKIDELNRSLEKKVAERTTELQQANRELSIKNKFKSNFLASMSHEIRTPLNSVLGFNQQLLYQSFDSQEDIIEINNSIIKLLQNYDGAGEEIRNILTFCKSFNTFFDAGERDTKYYHFLLLKREFNKLSAHKELGDKTASSLEALLDEHESILREEEDSVNNNLQRIQTGGEYLLQLVNSILDISKIEAGKINLVIKEVDIQSFVNDIVTTSYSYRSAKGKEQKVKILYSVSEDLPRIVLLDEKKIKQVLLNLMSNAIKFTDQGEIHLNCYCGGSNKICFSVSDTGMGISRSEASLIFNEFERTQNAFEIEGTGLGLALSKRLVELHQGTIRFESELAKGSTFYVELPLES